MLKNIITAGVTALVVALVVVVLVGGNQSVHLGGVTNYDTLSITGLTLGTQSTTTAASPVQTKMYGTSCTLIGTDISHTASTTKPYDCAITGVTSSDKVMAIYASTTPIGAGNTLGWTVMGAKASTTAGYVTILLGNFTGASAAPSVTSVGSTTPVFIYQ